jgi:hypothetical protein
VSSGAARRRALAHPTRARRRPDRQWHADQVLRCQRRLRASRALARRAQRSRLRRVARTPTDSQTFAPGVSSKGGSRPRNAFRRVT